MVSLAHVTFPGHVTTTRVRSGDAAPSASGAGARSAPKAFGKVYLDGVEDQTAFLEAYRAGCARRLPDGEIDYVRLRWRAVRRDDRSR